MSAQPIRITPPPPVIRRPRKPMPAVLILPLVKCGVRYSVTKWRVAK